MSGHTRARMADDDFVDALDGIEPRKRHLCEVDDCDEWANGKECEGCGGTFCSSHVVVMPEFLVSCKDCIDDASRNHIADHKLQIETIDKELSDWRKEKEAAHKEYSETAFLPTDNDKYHSSIARINKKYGAAKKNTSRKEQSKGIRVMNKFRRAQGLKPISAT